MTTTSETPLTPLSHLHKTTNQHIFQPPTSSPLTIPNNNDYFSSRSRKRQRPGSLHDDSLQQTPWSATTTPGWAQCPTPSDGMHMSSAGVNEKYCLAGGFDTPGLLATSGYEQRGGEDDGCLRRARSAQPGIVSSEEVQDGGRAEVQHLCGPLARERNGVPRLRSSPNGSQLTSQGWASYAFQLAGKFFSFGTGMIRGFYPNIGNAKEYDFNDSSLSDSWTHSRPPLPRRQRRGSTPVPGSWQDEEFLGDFEQDNFYSPTLSPNARPPNKRRQTDKDSWVLVGTPETNVDLSPKRKVSTTQRASLNPSSIPISASIAGSRPSGASRANSRRSLLPVISRRSSSYLSHPVGGGNNSPSQNISTPTQQQPHIPTLETHPTTKPTHRASLAPTRGSRPSTSSGLTHPQPESNSYISPETARLLKKQARQDKAADKAMSSMSRRLEDLIRQGQEALGTKVDVDVGSGVEMTDGEVGVGVDEGFVDEEW